MNATLQQHFRWPLAPEFKRKLSETGATQERGIRNNPAFGQGSEGGVMVYAGICSDGRTDLHIIRNGALTDRRYRDEILRPIVVPYTAAIRDDFMLMDDNCRSYRANLADNFLFEEGIIRIK
ncbi:transposable element Tcb2 transposase [Trichonephila clavipes]|nr:transposable element Tcb2 transposase [Trichonephila clavipes]